jgi:hypothetical protein
MHKADPSMRATRVSGASIHEDISVKSLDRACADYSLLNAAQFAHGAGMLSPLTGIARLATF